MINIKKRLILLKFFFITFLFFSFSLQSQEIVIPRDADTSRLRPPKLPLPETPKFDLRIEAPEKSPVAKAVDDVEFIVNDINIEGANYYPFEEIMDPFQKLIGKKISLSSLRVAVEKLENRYRSDGFFLVRVFIPPQEVTDGIFTIKVIEGYIESVFVEGGTIASRKKIESVMKTIVRNKPIDLSSLESVLLLLNDLPGISGSGVLRQGDKIGSSELIITLNNLPPKTFSVTVNNSASKTMGLLSTNLNSTINNPFKSVASTLGIGLSASIKNNNLRAYNTSYSQAIGNSGAIFSFAGLIADAEPKGSLKPLAIVSKSYSLAPRIRFQIARGRLESKYLEFGLTKGKSKTTLQSNAITIDKSTVADIGFSISNDIWFNGNTKLNFSLFHGLDIFGSFDKTASSPSVANFEQEFVKFKFTASHTYLLDRFNLTLKFNLQSQYTNDKLLAGEQISFGGLLIGRGYDGGAIAGDKGFGISFELTKKIEKNPLPILKKVNIEIYGFIDYAETQILADILSNVESSNNFLGSHGIGMRLSSSEGLSIDLMAAEARNTFPSADARNNPRYILSITHSF